MKQKEKLMLRNFIKENRSIYDLAVKELREVGRDNKGIVTVYFEKSYSSEGNFEGYVYKMNGEEYRFETIEEVQENLSSIGYEKKGEEFRSYIFKNKEISEKYEAERRETEEFNNSIKNARMEIRKTAKAFLFDNYKHTYIRYGLIPEPGKSYNFRDKHSENGVSVYEAVRVGDNYYIDVVGSIFTYGGLRENKEAYEVEGTLINEKGSDGEPLLENARIIRKVSGERVGTVDDFICEIME